MSTRPTPLDGTNLSILVGSSPVPLRSVPSPRATRLLALELTVRPPDGPASSVPVAWSGAPRPPATGRLGTAVLVVGRVRRRFFRAGGVTQSRTEVVATTACPPAARRGDQGAARQPLAVVAALVVTARRMSAMMEPHCRPPTGR